jgi:uncharacterized delta-60 repeat protein
MRCIYFFALVMLISVTVNAQTVDQDFNPELLNPGYLLDGLVTSDGKIVVVGNFKKYNGSNVGGIARLNADGTVDETFNGGIGPRSGATAEYPYSAVSKIIMLPNDKMLISGDFQSYNGVVAPRIARLNADGTIDAAFTPPPPGDAHSSDNASAIQADGKIIYHRETVTSDNNVASSIVRLNSDGSLDNTFQGQSLGTSYIGGIVIQPDGKILVCGDFSSYGSTTVTDLIRLNSDGSLDNTFHFDDESGFAVYAAAITNDNKIVISGEFDNVNGAFKKNMARLNSDGSLDVTFNAAEEEIFGVQAEASGSVLILGVYGTIKRLNADGTVDKSLIVDANNVNLRFTKAIPLSDGKFLLIGYSFNGTYFLAKLNADFTIDTGLTSLGVGPTLSGDIYAATVVPDGKVVLTGGFQYYNGQNKGGIVRLNADGTVDNTFNTGTGFNDLIGYPVLAQSDGKLIVQTQSTKINNEVINTRIVRLNTDGTLDATFAATKPYLDAAPMALGKDEKIVAWGDGLHINDVTSQKILRLNADGSTDATFHPNFDDNVTTAIALKNGKVVVAGKFKKLNDVTVAGLVRLNEDGTLDTSFNPKVDPASSDINRLYELSDGKILVCGSVTFPKADNSNGQAIAVRLLENGDVDNTFITTPVSNTISQTFYGTVLEDGSIMMIDNGFNIVRYSKDGNLITTNGLFAGTAIGIWAQASATTMYVTEGLNASLGNHLLTRLTFDAFPLQQLAPTNLTATATGSSVNLSWTESAHAQRYEVERFNGTSYAKVGDAPVNSYHDQLLTENTEYKYRVRAIGTGGISDYSNEATAMTITGLNETISGISVYPNPAHDTIFVTGATGWISVMDSLGKNSITQQGNSIDLSRLNAGVYFLKITTGDKVHVVKFLHN